MVSRKSLDGERYLYEWRRVDTLTEFVVAAISALLKWRVIASGALLGIFFIPSVFGEVFNGIFLTHWGHIFNLLALMKNIYSGLFGTFVRE